MADYSLRDAWWLQPKGPDNPLPALELGVRMSQYKSTMLLKEKELANDIARTEIARKEMEAKLKIQTQIAEGNAAVASTISDITDFSDLSQMATVWDTVSKHPMTANSKAVLGAQHMHESAVRAKTTAANIQSQIERRAAQTELSNLEQERKALLADSTVDLNDDRILDNNARRSIATSRLALDEKKFELQRMLGDSRMNVDDAKIAEMQQDIDLSERRLLIQEGNLALRKEELGQKGRRLDARAQTSYNNELKALNNEEEAKLKPLSASSDEANLVRKTFNLKRRALTGKFYGPETPAPSDVPAPATTAIDPRVPRSGLQTNEPPSVSPQPVAPESNPRAAEIRASLREGKITREQALQQLRELGFK